MDGRKLQHAGLKWLQELELVNDPQLINQLKMNVLICSPRIKEVEFLIYRENKSILVLLELSWLGRKFFKRSIFAEVEDVISQMLPTFKFRVTDDPRILAMAVARVKHALTGGKNEDRNTSPNPIVDMPISKPSQPVQEQERTGDSTNPIANLEEQSKTIEALLKESGLSDSLEKPQT
jgi:hypothetical protein